MPYPTYTIDPYAWVPLLSLKEHLNIPEATLTQDNVLTRYINTSTAMIESFLDRKVIKRQFTEYYDGRGQDRMLLRQWPVAKPTELWDDPSSLFTDVNNKYALTEFEVDGEGDSAVGIILLGGQRFSKGSRSIKVIYEGGYTLATVPAQLFEAVLLHAEFLLDMRTDRRIGISTKGKNQESTTFLSDLPEVVKNMLRPYQRLEVPLAYTGVQNN